MRYQVIDISTGAIHWDDVTLEEAAEIVNECIDYAIVSQHYVGEESGDGVCWTCEGSGLSPMWVGSKEPCHVCGGSGDA